MFANRCLLRDLLKSTPENQTNEVYIPGDAYDDVREILVHMYTPGGVEMSHESAQKLLPILHRYQIDSMVTMAERTMSFRLNDSSAPGCLQIADLYGLTRLRQAALESCARLDAARLAQVFGEMSLSMELRQEIFKKRVEILEQTLTDIQKSFSHSCTRVESRMERVPSNHCSEHNRPMAEIVLIPPTPSPIPGAPASGTPDPNMAGARMDAAASIRPAAVALANIDMRPLDDPARLSVAAAAANPQTRPPEVEQTAVCEKCAEQLKSHIIELCKRGLHKIPIMMCKNN
ncbi:Speckle-type POZ protein [Fasciola gigantica]|uniref:Speckle-type POZ protein n=1 Tax=Fasciola gigantica TaxID=46835 RepID=A0A504YYB3_FASGI|nr:Speckle-type POZ protein [Fasciola gigantica]